MTREYFIHEVDNWADILSWCSDCGCDVCEDIYDDYGRDDYVNECLVDWARDDSWTELRDRLNGIPDGSGYYRHTDYDEWENVDYDSDIDEYKESIVEWCDDHDAWDEEDEDPEPEYEPVPYYNSDVAPVLEPIEDEGFSAADLFASASEILQTIPVPEPAPRRDETIKILDPEPAPEPEPAIEDNLEGLFPVI